MLAAAAAGPPRRMRMMNVSSAKKRASHPSKFTPQVIENIKGYVKQGLGRDEIAKSLGVTVGSLQVTCSRLGISLRRPKAHYPSYDRLKTQSPPQIVEQVSRPKTRLAITIKREDQQWALDLPLSEEELASLGIEAALRGTKLLELIAQVLCEAVKKDMVGTILDGEERPD